MRLRSFAGLDPEFSRGGGNVNQASRLHVIRIASFLRRENQERSAKRAVGVLLAINYVKITRARERLDTSTHALTRRERFAFFHPFEGPFGRAVFVFNQFLGFVRSRRRAKAPERHA